MNNSKIVFFIGLSFVLLIKPVGTVFAQDEEFFVRRSLISKNEAIVLSAIYPGIGQMTTGQKVKGVSFFLAETVSLLFFLNANENYNTKLKIYERDLGLLDNIHNWDELLVQKNSLIDKNDELDNLHKIRNIALFSAGVVYAYNIIDSIFFSSSSTQSKSVENDNKRLVVKSAIIDNKPGILLSKSF